MWTCEQGKKGFFSCLEEDNFSLRVGNILLLDVENEILQRNMLQEEKRMTDEPRLRWNMRCKGQSMKTSSSYFQSSNLTHLGKGPSTQELSPSEWLIDMLVGPFLN